MADKHQAAARLMTLGITSKLAREAIDAGYTLSKLKAATKQDLAKHFESWDVETLYNAGRRKSIPEEVLMRLINECHWKCCICWKYSQETPVIIHHIVEHAKTQDDSYDNLVVLCLDHHALAHSVWQISRHPLPPELIIARKEEWVKALADFTAGLRPAPGDENLSQSSATQSDTVALAKLRSFLDRPALHQPFHREGHMGDFLSALTDIIRALNTGILKTREGDEIGRGKPRGLISNPDWQHKLDIITNRFEGLRTRIEVAIRSGEIHIQPENDFFYDFRNDNLPEEIDAMRDAIVLLFNQILQEAGLSPIPGVRTWRNGK